MPVADDQFERYKDALKRGHVASLRGHTDEALEAYKEAARIAPERATPHTSAGTALMRGKRPQQALAQYEAALRLAPREEAALVGRAQALRSLGRRSQAARAFDTLARFEGESGKLAEAVDAARVAFELEASPDRRRVLQQLIGALRRSEPREPGRMALERALRVLEEPALAIAPPPAAAPAAPEVATEVGPAGAEDHGEAGPEAGRADDDAVAGEARVASDAAELAADIEPDDAAAVAAGTGTVSEAGVTVPAEAGVSEEPSPPEAGEVVEHAAGEPEHPPSTAEEQGEAAAVAEPETPSLPEAEPEPEEPATPVIQPYRALARAIPEGATVDSLAVDAELAADAATSDAPDRLLDFAAACLVDGRVDAALDACYQGLRLDPDNLDLHLALLQLYDVRGWTTVAAEKAELVGRLVALDGDEDAADRLARARLALR